MTPVERQNLAAEANERPAPRWPGHVTPDAWDFFENGFWFEVAVDDPSIVNG
jgi:hypothetical protein